MTSDVFTPHPCPLPVRGEGEGGVARVCHPFSSRLCVRGLTSLLTFGFALGVGLLHGAVVTTHPYQGVTLIARTETSPRPVNIHVALIDLTAPGIRFKVTPPGGTRDTIRQRTLDFLNQEHAQLAINSHFFLPFPSDDTDANVVGFAASEGVAYSAFE